MQKNVASQKWVVFAFDVTTNLPKTGDAAQITANLRLDGGAANAVDDTNPTELEDGYYVFDLTQAETNADNIVICPVSSTTNIQVIGCPAALYPSAVPATTAEVATAVRVEMDANSTQLTAIVADTNELQTDWTNGGRLDLILDAILVDTGTTLPATLTTIEGKIDTIDTNVDAILVDTGTTLPATLTTIEGKIDTIDTNVDAILVDTGTTLPASLATIDTNVDAILVDTGTTLPATLTTIEGKIDTLDTNVDSLVTQIGTAGDGLTAIPWNASWDTEVQSECNDALVALKLDHLVAVADADDVVDNSVIAKLAASDGDWSGFSAASDSLEAIRDRGDAAWTSGAAAGGTELLSAEVATVTSQTVFTLASGADHDDAYNGQTIVLYDDSNSDYPSVRTVTDYVGSTRTVTIDSAPDFTLGTDDSVKVFALRSATYEADALLNRSIDNVEDTADTFSLGALVMFAMNFSITSNTLTAKKTSDNTVFDTYTLATTSGATPVTGVSEA